MLDYEEKSFWLATAGPYDESPPLTGDTDVDVAVVGGGFCGLSTAYYLRRADPSLRVAVLEDRVVGYGASGRNAGFAMTLMGLTLDVTAGASARRRRSRPTSSPTGPWTTSASWWTLTASTAITRSRGC